MEKSKKVKILLNILLGVCVVVLGVSIFQLTRTGMEYKQGKDEYDSLREEFAPVAAPEGEEEEVRLDYEGLRELNSDFMGWLDVPGTNISYPVVYRAGDNDTYLVKTFEGHYNGAGAIFADGRVAGDLSARHTILYGHNMKNNTMFAGVQNYLDSGYATLNSRMQIYTPQGVYHYRVVGARQTDVNDPIYQIHFGSDEEFARWAAELGAEGAGNVLTLSTCTNIEDDGRYVVFAVLEGVTESSGGPPATMSGVQGG